MSSRQPGSTVTVSVGAADLSAAIDAVRYAAANAYSDNQVVRFETIAARLDLAQHECLCLCGHSIAQHAAGVRSTRCRICHAGQCTGWAQAS